MIDAMKAVVAQLSQCADLRTREILLSEGTVTLLYVDDLCDSTYISRNIITPLVERARPIRTAREAQNTLLGASVGQVEDVDVAVSHILSGCAVLFFPFINAAIYCDAKKIATRSIEKSELDPSLRGPKESFNELLLDNLSLIRKRILSPDLKIEAFNLGTESKTNAVMLYMLGIAPPDLVKLMRGKLSQMRNPYVLGINYVAEELSLHKTTVDLEGHTEKPDTVVARLFEGRVAVIINGAPFVLTVPHFFLENFHSSDDYYSNRRETNWVRFLRYTAFLTALLLPGLYIALTTHHHALLPTDFVLKLAVARAGVPFPTVVELVLMQFFIELTREAGKRLPGQIGQSLSMIAGLIIGDAAVQIGLASPASVVVAGVYAICTFINPRMIATVLLWSLLINSMAVGFGLHGFYIGFMVFIAHLASLRSCSYPYLFPLGTAKTFKLKSGGGLFRGPLKDISYKILQRGKDKPHRK